MRIRSAFIIFSFLLSLAFLTAPPGASSEVTVRINGSGSALEVMKPLVEAYRLQTPGVSFRMEKPLGSSGAVKALLAGFLDIAVTSKPLKPEEAAQGGRITRYGKTPLAIVTHRDLPIRKITTRELQDIYSGKTRQWPNGSRIRIILRPNEDIDTKILKGLSPEMAAAMDRAAQRRGMHIAVTDPESDKIVAETAGAIGASGLTGIVVERFPLNVVALNGIMPSIQNLASGKYPLAKEISFVTTGRTPEAAVKFLEFVYSQRGRAIAEKAGVLITTDMQ